jgi:hypothetical protein
MFAISRNDISGCAVSPHASFGACQSSMISANTAKPRGAERF